MQLKPIRGWAFLLAGGIAMLANLDTRGADARRVISLNGTWQVAEGKLDEVPPALDHTVPVPGLLDMATPSFGAFAGPTVSSSPNVS